MPAIYDHELHFVNAVISKWLNGGPARPRSGRSQIRPPKHRMDFSERRMYSKAGGDATPLRSPRISEKLHKGLRFPGNSRIALRGSRRKLRYSSQDFTTAAESGAEWE